MATIERHDAVGKILVLVDLKHFSPRHPGHNMVIPMCFSIVQHQVQTEGESFGKKRRLVPVSIVIINLVQLILIHLLLNHQYHTRLLKGPRMVLDNVETSECNSRVRNEDCTTNTGFHVGNVLLVVF